MTYRVSVHGNCRCNELVALHNRHLVDRTSIGFKPSFWRDAERYVRQHLRLPNVDRMSLKEVVATYHGSKRRTYYQAMKDILEVGWNDKWPKVRMFVKPDKYSEADVGLKYPRAIQYRDPRYNLLIARYLKPFEEVFYKIKMNGLGVIAKGLTNYQRAEVLVEAGHLFRRPLYVMLDHSKFDSCVTVDHLKFCHKVYTSAFPGVTGLKTLLRHQLVNKCRSRTGIWYRIRGTKMSGDYDTALGNTLINYAVLMYFTRNVKRHILVDGDDSVLVMDYHDYGRLNFQEFNALGFSTTVETTELISEVEFCRSKVLPNAQPRLVRDVRRALSNYNVSTRYYPKKCWSRLMKGRALGELSQVRGVPIIESLMEKLAGVKGDPIYDPDSEWKVRQAHAEKVSISLVDRLDYEVQWGVPPDIQVMVESEWIPPDLLNWHSDFSQFFNNLPDAPLSESW